MLWCEGKKRGAGKMAGVPKEKLKGIKKKDRLGYYDISSDQMYEHRSFESAPQFCFVVRCLVKACYLKAFRLPI